MEKGTTKALNNEKFTIVEISSNTYNLVMDLLKEDMIREKGIKTIDDLLQYLIDLAYDEISSVYEDMFTDMWR